jgi:mRNA interferase RelE/StbE
MTEEKKAWQVLWDSRTKDDLQTIGRQAAERIRKAVVEKLSKDPRQGKRLKGLKTPLWSYRVGSYRVLYTIQEERLIILIVRVGDRKNIYREL